MPSQHVLVASKAKALLGRPDDLHYHWGIRTCAVASTYQATHSAIPAYKAIYYTCLGEKLVVKRKDVASSQRVAQLRGRPKIRACIQQLRDCCHDIEFTEVVRLSCN